MRFSNTFEKRQHMKERYIEILWAIGIHVLSGLFCYELDHHLWFGLILMWLCTLVDLLFMMRYGKYYMRYGAILMKIGYQSVTSGEMNKSENDIIHFRHCLRGYMMLLFLENIAYTVTLADRTVIGQIRIFEVIIITYTLIRFIKYFLLMNIGFMNILRNSFE